MAPPERGSQITRRMCKVGSGGYPSDALPPCLFQTSWPGHVESYRAVKPLSSLGSNNAKWEDCPSIHVGLGSRSL